LKSERNNKSALHHLREVSIRMMHQKLSFLEELSEFRHTVRWLWFEYSINGNQPQ